MAEALELFLDLRGLIEATHATESRLEQALARTQAAETAGQLPGDQRDEMYESLVAAQRKNLQRLSRLAEEIDREERQLSAEQETGNQATPHQRAIRYATGRQPQPRGSGHRGAATSSWLDECSNKPNKRCDDLNLS